MKKIIREKFFDRDTSIVAQDLVGKFLVRKIGKKKTAVMITETEAYDGFYDKASHGSRGRTKKSEEMFFNPGFFYIYLCYGVHFMLNIVTREENYPAAVLLRGAVGENRHRPLDGPGKITKFLQITGALNQQKAAVVSGLWFEDRGVEFKPADIKKTARIGVNYAGPVWSVKKLRFVLNSES